MAQKWSKWVRGGNAIDAVKSKTVPHKKQQKSKFKVKDAKNKKPTTLVSSSANKTSPQQKQQTPPPGQLTKWIRKDSAMEGVTTKSVPHKKQQKPKKVKVKVPKNKEPASSTSNKKRPQQKQQKQPGGVRKKETKNNKKEKKNEKSKKPSRLELPSFHLLQHQCDDIARRIPWPLPNIRLPIHFAPASSDTTSPSPTDQIVSSGLASSAMTHPRNSIALGGFPTDGIHPTFLQFLDEELREVERYVRLKPGEVSARRCVMESIQELTTRRIPQAQIQTFGSFAEPAVCCYMSDIDLAITGVMSVEHRGDRKPRMKNNSSNNVSHSQGNVDGGDPNLVSDAPSPEQVKQDRVQKWRLALEELDRVQTTEQGTAAIPAADGVSSIETDAGASSTEEQVGRKVGRFHTEEHWRPVADVSESSATLTSAGDADKYDQSDTNVTRSTSLPIEDAKLLGSETNDVISQSATCETSVLQRDAVKSLDLNKSASTLKEELSLAEESDEDFADQLHPLHERRLRRIALISASRRTSRSQTSPNTAFDPVTLTPSEALGAVVGGYIAEHACLPSNREEHDLELSELESATGLKRSRQGKEICQAWLAKLQQPLACSRDPGSTTCEGSGGDEIRTVSVASDGLSSTCERKSLGLSAVSSDTEYECGSNCSDGASDGSWDDLHVSITTENASRTRELHLTRQSRDKCLAALRSLRKPLTSQFCKKSQDARGSCQLIQARVPILKLELPAFHVDISIDGCNGADTSNYACSQAKRFRSFATVVMFLKVLLAQQKLDTPFSGGLGSFKLYVLVAFHMEKHLQLGGADRPADVLLSFLIRFGGVKLSFAGEKVDGVFRSTLTATSVIECDGKSADLSNCFMLSQCLELFGACWDRIRLRIQNGQRDAKLPHSLLDHLIDANQLRSDREDCLRKCQLALSQCGSVSRQNGARSSCRSSVKSQAATTTTTTTRTHEPVDLTVDEYLTGYGVTRAFLPPESRTDRGSAPSPDDTDITPLRSNKRARIESMMPGIL